MIKSKTFVLLFAGLVILSSATILHKSETELKDKLIGVWNWKTVINSQTKEESGIEMITMGMATEVKTEFKNDYTYIESKLRKGKTEYATLNGEWKLENNNVLSLKAKDKWNTNKILKLSNDSLLLEMNPQMNLLMIKQK